MPKIITTVEINAPIELAFDLARSIEFHSFTQVLRNEKPIGGVKKGLINLGETVTWEAKHFGIVQHLSVEITKFEKPFHFRDTMLKGAFKRFDHDHIFKENNGKVILTDIFDYDVPFSIFGKIFDIAVLNRYMTKFGVQRNKAIKDALESNAWKKYLKN